ncbi:MAG: ABC transporter permease [Acidobacteriota bacterium]
MNPDVVVESAETAREMAPAHIPASRLLYWSVRRELWENRSIYLAPLAVAALFLFGFVISTIRQAGRIRAALEPVRLHDQKFLQEPYAFAALLLMATTFLVTLFYCLDALNGERRDRSILFWKSLPVSDLTTVLSKASIPLIIMPLLTFAITVATQCIMMVLSSMIVAGRGLDMGTLWPHPSLFRMSVMLFYHLFFIHGLWFAPFYGWLLLVSGWSRRAAILWATLPLLAIGAVEKLVFNSSHFAAMLTYRFSGGSQDDSFSGGGMSMDPGKMFDPVAFMSSPGLWIGLIATAVFLAAAVRLRRNRQPN